MRDQAEELLADAAWLRRLARSLAGGSDGDDLAQDVWVAALRHPPDRRTPRRPWLAAALRKALRLRARGEGRRQEREQTAAERETGAPTTRGAPAPSPRELIEQAEAQRELADLLVQLEEPFRRTILLRYQRGMSAAAIARADGVPAGTVRWRLKEGLDRLRDRLDQRYDGDRRRWVLLFAGLAVPAATGAMLAGRARRIAVAAVLLVGLGAGLAWCWSRDRAAEPTASAPEVVPRVPPAPSSPAPAADALLPERRARVVDDPDAAGGVVEGRVLHWSTREPLDAVELVIGEDAGTHTLITDALGRFRFAAPHAGAYRLAVLSKPGFLPYAPDLDASPIEWVARAGRRVTGVVLHLVPAIEYTGAVVAADGASLSGAEVRIVDIPGGEQALESLPDRFVADARGEFRFHAPDYSVLEARAPGHGVGRAALDAPALSSGRLVIRVPPRGAPTPEIRSTILEHDRGSWPVPGGGSLSGRVVDAGGEPVPVFSVLVRRADAGVNPPPVVAPAVVDASGRFTIADLAAAPYRVLATARGLAPSTEVEAVVVAGETSEIELRVTAGGVVHGTVVSRPGGAPLRWAQVTVEGNSSWTASIASPWTSVVTDEAGRFELDGLAPGPRSIAVIGYRHHHQIVPLQVTEGARIGPLRVELDAITGGEGPRVELVGIGVKLEPAGDELLITGVVAGSGAAEVGLLAGDAIVAVDGTDIAELDFAGALQRIRGAENTRVDLAVRRGDARLELSVPRRKVRF